MTTQSRIFFVKSFKGLPIPFAARGSNLKATYTKRNCMASKYLSGLRERKASGFTSLTFPNRDRAKRTTSLTIRTPEQP